MKYIVRSAKTVDQATTDLEAAVKANGFGVLHQYDLKTTLNSKGVAFEPEVRILEVCNPQQAAKVLADDIDLNMALPCRISVYQRDGVTCIGMLQPTELIGVLSRSDSLADVATEVETTLMRIIEAAR